MNKTGSKISLAVGCITIVLGGLWLIGYVESASASQQSKVVYANAEPKPIPVLPEKELTLEDRVKQTTDELRRGVAVLQGKFEEALTGQKHDYVKEALEELRKNPGKLKYHEAVARAICKRIDEIIEPMQRTIDSDFSKTRDRLVAGLKLLGESQGSHARTFETRSQKDIRFSALSDISRGFETSYTAMAKEYENIPISDQLVQIRGNIEYLLAVKEILGDIVIHTSRLKDSQDAIDALSQLSVTIGNVETSLQTFSDEVLKHVLFDDDDNNDDDDEGKLKKDQ